MTVQDKELLLLPSDKSIHLVMALGIISQGKSSPTGQSTTDRAKGEACTWFPGSDCSLIPHLTWQPSSLSYHVSGLGRIQSWARYSH